MKEEIIEGSKLICPTTKKNCEQHPLQCNTTCWLTQPHFDNLIAVAPTSSGAASEQRIWYPVEYCGYYNIQSEPFYDSGINVLNLEECKEAEANANLCAAAPQLLSALEVCWSSLQTYGKHPLIKEQVENVIKKLKI